jgi:6-phosphogluconolactonase
MRILGWFAVILVLASATRADTFVYISVASEQQIAAYHLDPAQGKLTHCSDTKLLEGKPGALTVDPQRRFLFASIRSSDKLAAFRIDPDSGKLTKLNVVPAGPDPAYLATDRAGRFLLTAYYVDAKVTVHAIGKDGSLSDQPLQTIPTAEKAHASVPDPSNRFLYVPHTGPNAIFLFRLDAQTGQLTANSPARLETPKNTGPRHIVFHPTLAIAYVANEQGSSVTAYRLDRRSGMLTPLQTMSTLPKGFRGSNACAEIKVHPSGRFLYVANRGHDSIASFALDDQGKLSVIGNAPTEKTPRSFDIDPSGKYLFAAGQSSGKIASYRVDSKTGELKRLETYEAGRTPWWVLGVQVGER